MSYEYFQERYIFRVHTDSYAGNFERQLGAYVTASHDGTHGDQLAEWVRENEPEVPEMFDTIVMSYPDDNGYPRYSTIVPTPGMWNDGLGNSWPCEMWESEAAIHKYRATAIERNEKLKEGGREPREYDGPSRNECYYSVGIYLAEAPSQEVLDVMVERSHEFFDHMKEGWLEDKCRMGKYMNDEVEVSGTDLIRIKPVEEVIWTPKTS
jgi:hypothetical protein